MAVFTRSWSNFKCPSMILNNEPCLFRALLSTQHANAVNYLDCAAGLWQRAGSSHRRLAAWVGRAGAVSSVVDPVSDWHPPGEKKLLWLRGHTANMSGDDETQEQTIADDLVVTKYKMGAEIANRKWKAALNVPFLTHQSTSIWTRLVLASCVS